MLVREWEMDWAGKSSVAFGALATALPMASIAQVPPKSSQTPAPLLFTYDPGIEQYITNYAGPEYKQVAQLMREITTKTTFRRVTGGDKDGAKADVVEGAMPTNPAVIARVIIIENYTNGSSAISYSERAKSRRRHLTSASHPR